MARNINKTSRNPRSLTERLTFGLVNRRYRRFENAEQEYRGHQPPAYEGSPQLGQVARVEIERSRTQSSDALPANVANPNPDQGAVVTPPDRNPTNPGSAQPFPIQDALLAGYNPAASGLPGLPGPLGSTELPAPTPDPKTSLNRASSGSAPTSPPPVPRLQYNVPDKGPAVPPGHLGLTGQQGSPPDFRSPSPQDLLVGSHHTDNPPPTTTPPATAPPATTPPPEFHSGADIDCTVYSICNVEFGKRRGKHFFQEQKAYLPCGHAFGHQCLFWWLKNNRWRRGNCPQVGCISSKHECGHMTVPTTQPTKHVFTDTTRARIPWACEFCESPEGVELHRLIEEESQETQRAHQGRSERQGSLLRKHIWHVRETYHRRRMYSHESKLERQAENWFRKKWAAFDRLCWRLEASGKTGAFVRLVPDYSDGVENQGDDNTAPGGDQQEALGNEENEEVGEEQRKRMKEEKARKEQENLWRRW